jgi:hypothetical protein
VTRRPKMPSCAASPVRRRASAAPPGWSAHAA